MSTIEQVNIDKNDPYKNLRELDEINKRHEQIYELNKQATSTPTFGNLPQASYFNSDVIQSIQAENERIRELLNNRNAFREILPRANNNDDLAQRIETKTQDNIPTSKLTPSQEALLKAAEQGKPEAQFELAFAYQFGKGFNQNMNEAVKWYRKAAELGLARAQNNLGTCYDLGQGVEQSSEEAFKWYEKAADQGLPQAYGNLAVCYHLGRGIPYKDSNAAAKWFLKAAKAGLLVVSDYPKNIFDPRRNGLEFTNFEECMKYEKKQTLGSIPAQPFKDIEMNWLIDVSGPRRKLQPPQLVSVDLSAPKPPVKINENHLGGARWFLQSPQLEQICADYAEKTAPHGMTMRLETFCNYSFVEIGQGSKIDKVTAKWKNITNKQGHKEIKFALGMYYLSRSYQGFPSWLEKTYMREAIFWIKESLLSGSIEARAFIDQLQSEDAFNHDHNGEFEVIRELLFGHMALEG